MGTASAVVGAKANPTPAVPIKPHNLRRETLVFITLTPSGRKSDIVSFGLESQLYFATGLTPSESGNIVAKTKQNHRNSAS